MNLQCLFAKINLNLKFMINYLKSKNLILLFLFTSVMTTFVSCEKDEENDELSTSSECLSPSGLTIEVIDEDFFGDTVELKWNPEGNETQWEVKLAPTAFNSAKTFVVEEPTITVAQVLDVENAVFTVSAICGESLSSEAVAFPSLDGFTGPAIANMSAIIDGVSYEGLKPAGFAIFGDATSVTQSSIHEGIHLWVQGGTRVGTELSGVEINLFINKNHWSVGTHELKGGEDYMNLNEEVDTYVTYYNLDSPYKFDVEESGVLVITKFDLQERIIEGTFSFSYNVYDRNTGELMGNEDVESGTFKYSLDDEYFD